MGEKYLYRIHRSVTDIGNGMVYSGHAYNCPSSESVRNSAANRAESRGTAQVEAEGQHGAYPPLDGGTGAKDEGKQVKYQIGDKVMYSGAKHTVESVRQTSHRNTLVGMDVLVRHEPEYIIRIDPFASSAYSHIRPELMVKESQLTPATEAR
jgi:hypothetical protein